MKTKRLLGLKMTPLFIICHILIIVLLITSFGGLYLASTDFRGLSKLSEEERDELMETHSFRIATQAAAKMVKEPDKYGNIKDVTSIEYSYARYSAISSIVAYGVTLVCIRIKNMDDIYINVSDKFSVITATEYESIKHNASYSIDTSYSGSELDFIKEIVTKKDLDNILNEWKTEDRIGD